jgi:hypothetical protein
MSRDAVSGAALLLGSAAMVVTMLLHPAGIDHSGTPEQLAATLRLNTLAHGLAIAAVALTLFGALGIARRLDDGPGLASAGLVAFGFASFAATAAAAASGLIAPALFEHLAAATGAEQTALDVAGDLVWFFNQAFAKVYVVAASVALGVWSLVILRGGALPRWLGVYGCIAGPVVILALLSGRLSLGVHGFGLVVLSQVIWLGGAGVRLWSTKSATG